MRANVPILCLGPKGSDVDNIITETKTGKSFEYSDYENIKKYILDVFSAFKKNRRYCTSSNIEKYSVENQVNKVAGYLDEIS